MPYTISSPGSYYLANNLSVTNGSAITITANQVTLDLNGFTLSSTEASPTGTGILLAGGNTDITILNGHITGNVIYSGGNYTGSGFANGIYYSGSNPENVLVSHVSVSGCLYYGIYLSYNNSTAVDFCTVQIIGSYGIAANNVLRSTASLCGSVAILADITSDCYASSTGNYGLTGYYANNCICMCSGSGSGLSVYNANNCYGGCTGSGDGVDATTANNCQGQSSGSGYGLHVTQTAMGCYGLSATGTGLSANNANNCYGYSNGNGNGLDATTADNCQGVSTGINTGNSSGSGLSAYTANNSAGQSLNASGLNATYTATGCFGTSTFGIGLYADNASNCYGTSGGPGADGLYAIDIAIGCSGINSGGGTGLRANIANSCAGSGSPRLSVTNPYNMPYP